VALPAGYSKFIDSLASGLVNLHSDSFKAMLLDSYTIGTTQDDAQFVADVLAAPAVETSGTGYTAGGKALTTVTWTQVGGVWTFDCDDVLWTTATISPAYAVFYDSTPGTDATNPVIGYWDFGGTVPSSGVDFSLTVNDSGLFTFTNVV
jgi:hypothetical protein